MPDGLVPTYRRDLRDPAVSPIWGEWLLTNGLGGFAMSTLQGTPTRRYHGLLVAAMRPPVERVVALSAMADTLTLGPGDAERTVTLTPFHFRESGERAVECPAPAVFEKDVECRWTYDLGGGASVTKTLHLFDRRNAVALTYRVDPAGRPWRLDLRPLVSLRDFHSLLRRERVAARFQAREVPGGVLCVTREAGVHLSSKTAYYESGEQVWRSVEYIWEERRGVDCVEHLYSPGAFVAKGDGNPAEVTLFASVDTEPPEDAQPDRAARRERMESLAAGTIERTGGMPEDAQRHLAALAVASDDFIVRRGHDAEGFASVIAGYPWFSDWGRDTMISLPGLLLATGRHEEAFRALSVFGRHRRRGLIPNRFDDYSGPAHYNTVDASLWFLHAAAEWLKATGDRERFTNELERPCLDIIDAYRRGTDYGIQMDPLDALINAGSTATQLTWMDAQRDGVTFTPRYGKAVEINALWHHGLIAIAGAVEPDDADRAKELRELAARVRESFREHFVKPAGGLFDRIVPSAERGGRQWQPAEGETRPNQLFAVSLEHSPLEPEHQRAVVEEVRAKLYTPAGPRTLGPGEPGYRGRLEGSMFDRDSAYHNGTVWPWLMGPLAEAVLRAGSFSDDARAEARGLLEPLIAKLDANYPGSIAEIYDGDHTDDRPQRPDGCIAQAWSIAETLRVYALSFA